MSDLREPDAILDAARRVPDLEPRVPQRIEQELDDALAPAGLLVGQEEQEVDIGARRQRAAAIAADRDDGDAFGLGWDWRREQLARAKSNSAEMMSSWASARSSAHCVPVTVGKEPALGLLACAPPSVSFRIADRALARHRRPGSEAASACTQGTRCR